jgi:MFS family permease
LVDRLGARLSAICADLVSGLAILGIPLLYHTVGLHFWQLLVLVMTGSLLDLPGVTARRSMLPELAALGNVRLERVNSFLEGNNQISILLGPPIAGVLIGVIGASNVLWIDAGSSLLSVATIVLFVPTFIHGPARDRVGGYFSDLRAGLQFFWSDRVLRWIALSLAVGNAFGAPFYSLMLAVYIKDRYDDARYLGIFLSAFGLGALIGTVLYGAFGFRVPRRLLMVIFLLSLPLIFIAVATTLPVLAILGLLAVSGISDGPVNPMLVTVRLERIPIELRGRVFAATSAVSQLLPPATIPLAGLLIEQFGMRATAIALMIGSLVAGVAIALNPIWRRLDETAAGHPDAAQTVVAN